LPSHAVIYIYIVRLTFTTCTINRLTLELLNLALRMRRAPPSKQVRRIVYTDAILARVLYILIYVPLHLQHRLASKSTQRDQRRIRTFHEQFNLLALLYDEKN